MNQYLTANCHSILSRYTKSYTSILYISTINLQIVTPGKTTKYFSSPTDTVNSTWSYDNTPKTFSVDLTVDHARRPRKRPPDSGGMQAELKAVLHLA